METMGTTTAKGDISVARWALPAGHLGLGNDHCSGGIQGHLTLLLPYPLPRTFLISVASSALAKVPSWQEKNLGSHPALISSVILGQSTILSLRFWPLEWGH